MCTLICSYLLPVCIITHADESIAFIYVCLCVAWRVWMCVHYKTKTAETTFTKPIWRKDSSSRVLARQLILGQKVKGQGQRTTKCRNIFQLKAIQRPAWVCTLSSGQRLVFCLSFCLSAFWLNKSIFYCKNWQFTHVVMLSISYCHCYWRPVFQTLSFHL